MADSIDSNRGEYVSINKATSTDPLEGNSQSDVMKSTQANSLDPLEGNTMSDVMNSTQATSFDTLEENTMSDVMNNTQATSLDPLEGNTMSDVMNNTQATSFDTLEENSQSDVMNSDQAGSAYLHTERSRSAFHIENLLDNRRENSNAIRDLDCLSGVNQGMALVLHDETEALGVVQVMQMMQSHTNIEDNAAQMIGDHNTMIYQYGNNEKVRDVISESDDRCTNEHREQTDTLQKAIDKTGSEIQETVRATGQEGVTKVQESIAVGDNKSDLNAAQIKQQTVVLHQISDENTEHFVKMAMKEVVDIHRVETTAATTQLKTDVKGTEQTIIKNLNYVKLILDKQSLAIGKLSQQLDEQSRTSAEQPVKIGELSQKVDEQTLRINKQTQKLDKQSRTSAEQSMKIGELSHKVDTQTLRISKQTQKLDEQSRTLAEQSMKIGELSQKVVEQSQTLGEQSLKINNQLKKLDKQSQTLGKQSMKIDKLSQTISELSQTVESASLGNTKLRNVVYACRRYSEESNKEIMECLYANNQARYDGRRHRRGNWR